MRMAEKTTEKKENKQVAEQASAADTVQADVYRTDGTKSGTVALPAAVFNVPWNDALVHQVVVSMQANARTPVAHTKDRGDVSGGGRKPWRQKGTGRARHGSIRSPLWKGGGVTFGPRKEKSYAKSINKKMRAKALYAVLSRKLRNGELLFIDTLSFNEPKAVEAKRVLTAIAKIKGFEKISEAKRNAALIALERDTVVAKSFGNFSNVLVSEVRNLNPVEVLRYKYVVIVDPEEAAKTLANRMQAKREVVPETAESVA